MNSIEPTGSVSVLIEIQHAALIPFVADDRGIFGLVRQALVTQPAAGLIGHHPADGGDIGRRRDEGVARQSIVPAQGLWIPGSSLREAKDCWPKMTRDSG